MHVKAIVVDNIDKQSTFAEPQNKMNGNKIISSIWYLGVVLLLCLIMIILILVKILIEDTQSDDEVFKPIRAFDTL